MNKTALKNFATEARLELLEKVELQARKIGITSEAIQKANVESSDAVFIDGKQLSDTERTQRNKLIKRIEEIGFDRVMEETAYTWFNRFIALRYMEVNNYLPTKVRVLSSETGSAEPDMMKEALSLDLDLDKEKVYEMKMNNETDELFKYLIKMHCNDLNRYMPFMFETIEDYTEILFPEGLLGTDSFVRKMTDTEVIPEDNWEKIEIIGWLYQYYIADEKDRVFKAKKKYKAEEIPFATQLFTPDWIVQYMVQNSLGRYWVEAHPEHSDLIDDWDFYIQHQQENFEEKIAPYVNKQLNVEDIKCFDPAMGSGHILVYMFDVLYEIYSKCGYMEREVPRLIIENNLYGLDIDDRAYQLASFSIVMKALQYNRRFLRSIEKDGLSLNLASVQETNGFTNDTIIYIAGEDSGAKYDSIKAFLEQYISAKTFGSLIKVTEKDTTYLENRLQEVQGTPVKDLFQTENREQVLALIPLLIKQTKIMSQQYDVVVMNPPYMGLASMNKELSDFLRKNYPDSKGDLFASFQEVEHYLKQYSFYAAVNQHSWMFLSSYEKLRDKIIQNKFIDTMLHLGPRAFEEIGGEVVQSTAFVIRNTKLPATEGTYLRLTEDRTAAEKRDKLKKAVKSPSVQYKYLFNQENFNKIPGSPIAYWASPNIIKAFEEGEPLGQTAEVKRGMTTSDNKRFLRSWTEVSSIKIFRDAKNHEEALESKAKWFPYSKGGGYRKWYGFLDDVINWENSGQEVIEYAKTINKSYTRTIVNISYYFKPSVGFSYITSGPFSMRWIPEGFIYDSGGPGVFADEDKRLFILACMNSKPAQFLLKLLNPTINLQIADVVRLPLPKQDNILGSKGLSQKVMSLIEISKEDWDTYETSWGFSRHPLLSNESVENLSVAFNEWETVTNQRFNTIKTLEEELNQVFIELYSLEREMTPDVTDESITVRRVDIEYDIKTFISYAIGCSFGRYSLDEEGLIYAGGDFNLSRYQTFPADEDNILPILSGAYFEDDIVTRFIEFVRLTFSEETLEENLNFVADALGRRKNETARETLRRYFLNDFYKDHVKVYKKRPIYWLFTSGKEKAFNCLIYMHRYDKTTLSRIRTDYLHEVQTRLDAEKSDLLEIINGDYSTREINSAKRELKVLDRKIDELVKYDELLHHMADTQIEIDLDDGVKFNYEKFKGLVPKI